jgi:Tfp pilus assembly protein PilF
MPDAPLDTPREHLNWAIERALEYFDQGDRQNALASFLSDVRKHPGTEWIFYHPMCGPMMLAEVERGREAFRKAMDGWSVGGR